MEKIIAQWQDYYKAMVLTRAFDNKAIALQRTGKIGTYPPIAGQEAISVGIGFSLKPKDVFVPNYRDQGTQLMRGVTMEEILLYWSGSERGNDFKATIAKEDFPNCVPIASQCLHAAGIATAIKLRAEKRAVLVTCGDGGTSEGDFYEAINVAGIWQLPLVIVICNNQWAISVARQKQSAANTLAQKAMAGGIPGEQIDGNDVITVVDHLSQALTKARDGGGATVIEAVTYRLGDHTTADDASRYRNKEEVAQAWQNEPIGRLRQKLLADKAWSEEQEKQLQLEVSAKVEAAVNAFLNQPKEDVENIFNFQYENLTTNLILQRETLRPS